MPKLLKTYLNVKITAHDGRQYTNHLQLGEFAILYKILKENKEVTVKRDTMTPAQFKATFGT